MSEPAPIQFGPVPTAIIATGIIAALNDTEARLYLVLCAYSGCRDWSATVSNARLGELVGKTDRTIRRTTARLAEAGLIRVDAGGGREKPNTYAINTNPDTLDVRLLPSKPGHSTCPPLSAKPGHSEPETRTNSTLNPDTLDVRRSEVQNIQSTASEFSFPLRGRGEWNLPADRLAEYIGTFPGLDIPGELRKARLWIIDNPDRRKTARGMPRFLSGWLTRAKPDNPAHGQRRTTSGELDAICPLVEPTDEDFAAAYGDSAR